MIQRMADVASSRNLALAFIKHMFTKVREASIQCRFPSWALFRVHFQTFLGPFFDLEYLGFFFGRGGCSYYFFENSFGGPLLGLFKTLFNDTRLVPGVNSVSFSVLGPFSWAFSGPFTVNFLGIL